MIQSGTDRGRLATPWVLKANDHLWGMLVGSLVEAWIAEHIVPLLENLFHAIGWGGVVEKYGNCILVRKVRLSSASPTAS